LAKELRSLKIWQRQETLLKEKERVERDQYIATLKEEVKVLSEK